MSTSTSNDLNTTLDFSQNKVYGRQDEIERLHVVYRRLCSAGASGAAQMVAMSGESGIGKSVVIQKFIDSLQQEEEIKQISPKITKPCYVLTAKFNSVSRSVASIFEAYNQFCNGLLINNVPRDELDRIKESIEKDVGLQRLQFLKKLVPFLTRVFGEQENDVQQENSALFADSFNPCVNNKSDDMVRTKWLLNKFLQSICTVDRPVIFVLDNLHWADPCSLAMLKSLITDEELKHCMFIALFQSKEGGINNGETQPPLTSFLSCIDEKSAMERMKLEELSMDVIAEFISDTLGQPLDTTKSLAEVVYNKTSGNMFFVSQLLQELHRHKILQFSFQKLRWEWDIKQIEAKACILSDNVVETIVQKLQHQPRVLQKTLVIAALLQASFDVETLHGLMDIAIRQYDNDERGHTDSTLLSRDDLIKMLDLAISVGLLIKEACFPLIKEQEHNDEYAFTHCRIQEAAASLLVSEKDKHHVCLRIGTYLMKRAFSRKGEDWMMFVAVNHLNSTAFSVDGSCIADKDSNDSTKCLLEPLDLARLNLAVGEKSITVSALMPASRYLQKAIEAMKQVRSPWDNHYDLILRLYQAASDVELTLGNIELSNEIGEEILDNAKCLQDKLLTYASFSNRLTQQRRVGEALKLDLEVLEQLDEYPKRFHAIHILNDYISVRKVYHGYSTSDIEKIPIMTDKTKIAVMEFLSQTSIHAFSNGKTALFALCILRQMHLSLRYGICGSTAQAVASYGCILGEAFGNQKGALHMGQLAMKILDVTKAKQYDAVVLNIVAPFIQAWSVPLPKVLEYFHRGYKSGMETGDLEMGYISWQLSHLLAYAAGFPLEPINEGGRKMEQQIQHYFETGCSDLLLEVRMLVQCLMGNDGSSSSDSGASIGNYDNIPISSINWDVSIGTSPDKDPAYDSYRLLWRYFSRMQLAYYFGYLDAAEQMVTSFRAHIGDQRNYVTVSYGLFFQGLIASAQARQTQKKKYKKCARKSLAAMKGIMKTRGINNLHKYYLMEAEYATLSRGEKKVTASKTNGEKRRAEVKKLFDKAISAASKAGFTQDAALGNELAGEYFMAHIGTGGDGDDDDDHKFWSKKYFTAARDLYYVWGAHAKVDYLTKNHGDFIEKASVVPQRSDNSFTSNRRFWVKGEKYHHDASNKDFVNFSALEGSSSIPASSLFVERSALC